MHPYRLPSFLAAITTLAILALTACAEDPSVLGSGASAAGRGSGVEAPVDEADATSPPPASPAAHDAGADARPSSPAQGGGIDGGTSSPGAEQACVDGINAYRAKLGLPALARWNAGEVCATGQCKADAQKNQPHSAFPGCGEFAQNECPGWPGPARSMIDGCLQTMWAEGPGGGHYENMASPRWTQVSCGFTTLPSGDVWAVQNFR
jgi:hypothetical protein